MDLKSAIGVQPIIHLSPVLPGNQRRKIDIYPKSVAKLQRETAASILLKKPAAPQPVF